MKPSPKNRACHFHGTRLLESGALPKDVAKDLEFQLLHYIDGNLLPSY